MIRIVKMTFDPKKVNEFLENFDRNKENIKNFNGVKYLELLNDKDQPNVYFTYSIWQSEKHLEMYKNSDLFKSIWRKVKPLFIEKPEAWSVESITVAKSI